MSPREPSNPVVARLVVAINSGDRDAFLATLSPDARLTDDGNPRSLTDWIDREIFSAHGHLTVESEEEQGLHLIARYRNDTWGRCLPSGDSGWRTTRSAASRPARSEPASALLPLCTRKPWTACA